MNSQSSPAPKPSFTRTFYQRPLPDSCIAFTTPQGRALFASAMQHQGLKSFYHLIQQHSTQSEPAYCGISTLTIALNAFSLDPRRAWKDTPWRWYDESLLNCCVPLSEIQKTGITIPTFACLAKCQGLQANVHYAQNVTEQDFRNAVKQACVEDDSGKEDAGDRPLATVLIVSYYRGTLQQTGTGHFSPIAAYDQVSDSVLILDTARFKYGVHWVSLPLLFQAMLPVDPDTSISRGFVLLRNVLVDHDDKVDSISAHLPVCILLQSTMKQAPARKAYKDYLDQWLQDKSSSAITWEAVWRYWTSDLTDFSYIWTMTKPSQIPAPHETGLIDLIAQVRALIKVLMPPMNKELQSSVPCCGCGPHDQRTLDLRPEEVIFIVYLASLSEEDRVDTVMAISQSIEASDVAKKQLLEEAQLLAIAIQMSDVIESTANE
jgi:glutathione gamma-glutamylcysteinyltransferase